VKPKEPSVDKPQKPAHIDSDQPAGEIIEPGTITKDKDLTEKSSIDGKKPSIEQAVEPAPKKQPTPPAPAPVEPKKSAGDAEPQGKIVQHIDDEEELQQKIVKPGEGFHHQDAYKYGHARPAESAPQPPEPQRKPSEKLTASQKLKEEFFGIQEDPHGVIIVPPLYYEGSGDVKDSARRGSSSEKPVDQASVKPVGSSQPPSRSSVASVGEGELWLTSSPPGFKNSRFSKKLRGTLKDLCF